MELQFYWHEPITGDETGHYWGQLCGSIHRLRFIIDELEGVTYEDDASYALTLFTYHLENYLLRSFELRERAFKLLASFTGKKKLVEDAKHPAKRAAAIAELEKIALQPAQAFAKLLAALDEDVALRNQHTHDTFLQVGINTGIDIFEAQDALLDLSEQPAAKMQLEDAIKGEIKRLAEQYGEKFNAVFDTAAELLIWTERYE